MKTNSSLQRGIFSLFMLSLAVILMGADTPRRTAEFEDYKWGEPASSIEQKLIQKGKIIPRFSTPPEKETISTLAYNDEIFGRRCRVSLISEERDGLYKVEINWARWMQEFSKDNEAARKLDGVAKELMTALVERYGEPSSRDNYAVFKSPSWDSVMGRNREIEIRVSHDTEKQSIDVHYIDVATMSSMADRHERARNVVKATDRARF